MTLETTAADEAAEAVDEVWHGEAGQVCNPGAVDHQVHAHKRPTDRDNELAIAEGIAQGLQTRQGVVQEFGGGIGEVQPGDGALGAPIANQEDERAEDREAGSEKDQRTMTQGADDEGHLDSDDQQLGEVEQILAASVAAEGAGEFGGLNGRGGARGLFLPQVLEFFKSHHGSPPTGDVRWPV